VKFPRLPFLKASQPSAPVDHAPLPTALTFSAPVEFTAAVPPQEGQPATGGLPTFKIRAYDGSAMRVQEFFWPVIVELKGAKARKTVKVLRQHDIDRVVGHATKTTIDATGIAVEGIVSGTGEDAQEIVATSKNEFPWEASIGCSIDRSEFLEAGKTDTVNGRAIIGPMHIVRRSTIGEVSFVTIGAAEKTTVEITAATGESEPSMTFEQWLKANGFDPATVTDAQGPALQASYKATIAAAAPAIPGAAPVVPAVVTAAAPTNTGPAPVVLTGAQIIAEINAAHVRISEINQLCAAAGNPTIELAGQNGAAAQRVSTAAHAIANNWTRERAELEVLRATRPVAPPPGTFSIGRGNGGTSGGALNAAAIQCALCFSAGLSRKFIQERAGFDEATIEAAESPRNGLRGMGIQQLFHMVLAGNGHHVMPGARIDGDLIRAAFHLDRTVSAAAATMGLQASGGGFSTISLSGILSNLANKALLERFAMLASAVPEIAYETDTNDFKAFTRYRLDGKGDFSEVGQDGELKHVELVESAYSNQLKTYGGIIALTRQMIRNDDLGAFLQIPQIFGSLAVSAREQIVMALILANAGSFFGTGNKNYQSGAPTAFSIDSIDAAVQLFLSAKNKGGHFVLTLPDRLLVPPALKATADRIFKSTTLIGQGANAAPVADGNPHAGQYRPIVSPYLGTVSGLSGASDVAWYLLAPPGAGMAVVQVGYLAGQRTPIVESAETDFNTLGMQWRGYWDFGAALFEPRAGVKSKGEA